MTNRPCFRASQAVPALLALAMASQAQSADTEVVIGGERGHAVYEVALDELQAVCVSPAALPGQVQKMTPDGMTQLDGVDSLPQLESVASSLNHGAAGRTTVAAVLYPAGGKRDPKARTILSRQLAMRVKPGTDLAALAGRHHCRVVGDLGQNVALLEPLAPGLLAGSHAAKVLSADPAVAFAEVQVHRLVATRYTPLDPEFHTPTGEDPAPGMGPIPEGPYPSIERKQWHLYKAPRGMMLEPVWGSAHDVKDGYTGVGIRVATVDTGVDTKHPDLGVYPDGNLKLELAYNFAGGAPYDVRPQSVLENHGTAIAGLIAEREGKTGRNSIPGQRIAVGGVGVAFESTLVPLRFITSRDMGQLPDPITTNGGPADANMPDVWPGKTDAEFRQVVNYQLNPQGSGQQIHVSCNSWGNTGVSSFMSLGSTAYDAFESGVTTGRYSRGMIFVWAAGNDHGLTIPYRGDLLPEDNASWDAWLNRFTIPVGALNRGGRKSSYSEIGPSLLVCAPGGEYNFVPYNPYRPTDSTTGGGPEEPIYKMHGLITTDRSRETLVNGIFKTDPGYNPGEKRDDGNAAMMNSVAPTPNENLPQWILNPEFIGTILGYDPDSGLYWGTDIHADLLTEGPQGTNNFDLDGDGYYDTGEDLDHDRHVDLAFWFDADGDGHQDLGEDVNNNGIFDDGEDINGDGILQFNEDLNGNGTLDPGEDLDGDGRFDVGGTVTFTPAVGTTKITRFISEGLWLHPRFGYPVAGEPDFNRPDFDPNHIIHGTQESAVPVVISNHSLIRSVNVDEDLNHDHWPVVDPTPTANGYRVEGTDWMFDQREDFNHDTALTWNSDLNGDHIWNFEDYNDDHKWTSGNYSVWSNPGYTHPIGPGFDVAGTSFAAANASGVIALMLQARPELTWRDVQLILAHRSRLPRESGDGVGHGWTGGPNMVPQFFTKDGYNLPRGLKYDLWVSSDTERVFPDKKPEIGFYYNHWYGFGAINALKAVYGCDTSRTTLGTVPATLAHPAMQYPGWPVTVADQIANPGALRWPLLPAEELPVSISYTGTSVDLPRAYSTGFPRLHVDLLMEVPGGVTDFRMESVELHLNITINNRSSLTLGLVSPSGTIAMIPQRLNSAGGIVDAGGTAGTRNLDYTFTLRNFLGERPEGSWRIIIVDTIGDPGVFNAAKITAYGHRPYPIPTGGSITPSSAPGQGGIAATIPATFQVNGSNFRRNAANEVTMTKAIWLDHAADLSSQCTLQADDLLATVASGDVVADLQTTYVDDNTVTVSVPAALTMKSPGDATILIANPALPFAQYLPSIKRTVPYFGYQLHPGPAPHPKAAEQEDYYLLDAWESQMTHVLASDTFLKGVQVHYPGSGYDLRIKSSGIANSLYLRYSRPPTVQTVGDQLLPASTPIGAPFTVTFVVDDPDINPATVNAGRTGLEETVTVSSSILNHAAVDPSSLSINLVSPGPGGRGTGTYILSGVTAGTTGLSLISINATDTVTTRSSSFRVGILADVAPAGCGGGMGLGLLGGPLAFWLLRRRRR